MKVKFLVVASSIIATYANPGIAQPTDDYFKGKTISLIIGFGGGGTYDYYGRLVSRYYGRHLPGNPNIVIQSMPGAGSFTAANYIYSIAPKDGTVIGIVTQTLAIEEKLGTTGVRYKSAEFNWIGRATTINQVTLANANIKNIDMARKEEVTLATTGAGSPSDSYPRLLNALAGTRFKLIGPYNSSTEGMLSIERGEVAGALTSWNTLKISKADWLAEKKINILVQYTRDRAPDLANVPTAIELTTSPEGREMMTFAVSGEDIGRSFLAPPGMPKMRVDTMRNGFVDMTKDPDLLKEIEKAKTEFEPLDGWKLQDLINEVDKVSPATLKRLQDTLKN